MAAVQAAIDAYSGSGGLTIRFTGTFDFASISDPCAQWNLPAQIVEIKKKNDITLLGADGSAANFGIHVASSSSNIIIRNMTFGLLPGGDASDAISVEGMSGGFPTNVWIDHNELFSSMARPSTPDSTSTWRWSRRRRCRACSRSPKSLAGADRGAEALSLPPSLVDLLPARRRSRQSPAIAGT